MNKFKILILDLDGVLITNPTWKPDDIHADGYSDFNANNVENLNKLLKLNNFEIWLSSTRRVNKSIDEFKSIFRNRRISQTIAGFLPVYSDCSNRKDEILKFLNEFQISNYLIIDDDKSLNGLDKEYKKNLILTELIRGFDNEKLEEAIDKIKRKHS